MKGIMTTYASVLQAREFFVDLSGLTPDMSYLLVLPFNHIAGFTGALTYLLTGCTIGLIENVNASKLQSGLRSFEPNYFAMVPKVYEIMEQKIRQKFHEKGAGVEFIFNTMLKISGFLRKNFGCKIGRKLFQSVLSDVFGKNIHGIGTGASPCPSKTTEFFLNMGIEWANLYASTETSVPITATGIHDRYPVGTVGNVNRHKGISIKIHNPDKNGVGEIYVKSVLMMKGYFRDPIATQEAFDGDYFKTGDSGYIDEQGYLYVTGRVKEAILLPTGKKVSPTDLDQLYQPLCPEGCTLASCGISVTGTGYDEIHVFIEAPTLAEEEKGRIKNKIMMLSGMGSVIYPVKAVHFISKIPLTSVGKVKRFKLKELIHGEQALEIQNELSAEPQTVRDIIKDIIFEINQRPVEILTDESYLKEDLGLDSLSMFELSVAIETALNIQIMENLGDVKTFGELVALASGIHKTNACNKHYNIQNYPVKKNRRKEWVLHLLMWISCHLWSFEISGEENIPSNGNFILAPNHESHLDGIWVWTAICMGIRNKTILNAVDFRKICCLAKEEHLEHGFSKFFMSLVGGIPVDRTGNTLPALKRCEECLKNGYYVLIHPEGTRTRDGEIKHFKKGAAEMAFRTGTTIIPVTITGAREIYKPENKLPKVFNKKNHSRYKLSISFGEAISPAEQNVCEMTTSLEKRVRGETVALMKKNFLRNVRVSIMLFCLLEVRFQKNI